MKYNAAVFNTEVYLMPFLPLGEEIPFQNLKCVVSHFIIGNDQAFASDSSVQPVPEQSSFEPVGVAYIEFACFHFSTNL